MAHARARLTVLGSRLLVDRICRESRSDSQPDRPGSDVEVEPHGHLPLRR